MLSTTVDVVVQALRLNDPPAVARAARFWVGIHVITLLLSIARREFTVWLWRRIGRRPWPGRRVLPLPGMGVLRMFAPTSMLGRWLPEATARYSEGLRAPATLDDLAGHRYIYAFLAANATYEELLFRGVPIVSAITLGYDPMVAVATGSIIWALGHDLRTLPQRVLSGTFYAWLWLSGTWYLAVAFHVGTNALCHTLLRIGDWIEIGRYPGKASTR